MRFPAQSRPLTVVVSGAFREEAAGEHLFIGNECWRSCTSLLPLMSFIVAADGNVALTFFDCCDSAGKFLQHGQYHRHAGPPGAPC